MKINQNEKSKNRYEKELKLLFLLNEQKYNKKEAQQIRQSDKRTLTNTSVNTFRIKCHINAVQKFLTKIISMYYIKNRYYKSQANGIILSYKKCSKNKIIAVRYGRTYSLTVE